jgi:predicted DNA-binding ribbon-helix-helix protein
MSPIPKRSITISDLKTSVGLEDGFWQALTEIANERGTRVSDLIQSIKGDQPANLSSALRLFVLGHYQDQISARKNQITTTSPCCSTS